MLDQVQEHANINKEHNHIKSKNKYLKNTTCSNPFFYAIYEANALWKVWFG